MVRRTLLARVSTQTPAPEYLRVCAAAPSVDADPHSTLPSS